MTFLAIDPGSTQSAFVEYGRIITRDGEFGGGPRDFGIIPNHEMLQRLRQHGIPGQPGIPADMWPDIDKLVIEWMQPRGMPTSAAEFETMYYVGRFAEAAIHLEAVRITRLKVKQHICGSNKANDSNVRAALIDRYGGSGGKRQAVGLKADPGPLYGVSKDVWAALALAITFDETR